MLNDKFQLAIAVKDILHFNLICLQMKIELEQQFVIYAVYVPRQK